MSTTDSTLRYRHNAATTVAAVIVMISGLSLATWAPYLLPLLVIPLLAAIWSWRAGTDVSRDAVTVRAAVGSRRVPWADITGFSTDAKGHVLAQLGSGSALALTAVPAADLPRIIAASGRQLLTEDRPGR
ncbi:MAG TPA: PH domain-containing protein [Micromonosporaceae bacterium]